MKNNSKKPIAPAVFLSHLSGDEATGLGAGLVPTFLSHLSGDEVVFLGSSVVSHFLSHLSGDEEELYLKEINYNKAWRTKHPILPSISSPDITD